MIEVETPLFASLPEEALRHVRAALQSRRFAIGETVVSDGETLSELFIIVTGEALVVGRDWHGERQTLALLGPGECFGELSMLSGEPASAAVEAVTELDVCVLPQAAVSALAGEHPELARNLSALLAERLRRSNERALRAQRARTTALIVCGGAPWGSRLSYLLARSIAWHTREHVLFIDCAGGAEALRQQGVQVSAVDTVATAPLSAYAIDGERESHDFVEIAACDESELPGGALRSALERAQMRARNIVVVARLGSPLGEEVARRADNVVALANEPDALRLGSELDASPGGEQATLGLVLVSDRSDAPTVGDLRLGAVGRWPTQGIVPGGADALFGEIPPGSPTGRAIDRLARRLAGFSIGLALGAGGAKGYAHIGVVQGLVRAGVPVDCVTGCSIGAPLAAGVAADWSVEEIRGALDAVSAKAVRPNMPFISILTSRSIRMELKAVTKDARFEDLPTPLGIVAVDIQTGEEVLLRHGLVWPAMVASMAFPGIYEPVRLGHRYLVDGGVLNPVPVSGAVALGADVVISSVLGGAPEASAAAPPPSSDRRRTILESIARSLEIMQGKITQDSCTRADVAIESRFSAPPGLLDFRRGREMEHVGEEAVERALPKLRSVLPWLA